MPSQSLYRKWRSRTFAELIGQDHVRETLSNALRSGRVSHAYLFCGPRGTGKTSTARLLAKTVNCQNPADGEPCNQCESCESIQSGRAMDIIEIDAASNRGIDEIRDLRDKVGFAPSQSKFKFYILDEVHMLTTEAFNALLKTLEEPPPHAIFVLVTTEPHKIPATITSRCQRFDFRRIGIKDLLRKLERVCREEGLDIEPAALEMVARSATGSFRDAESLLDQLAAYGTMHITAEYVQKLMGLIPAQTVTALVDALLKRDSAAGLALINEVADEGHDLRQFNREIVEHLHRLLLVKAGNAALLKLPEDLAAASAAQAGLVGLPDLTRMLRVFSQADQGLRGTAHPQLPLELAFLDACAEAPATVAHPRLSTDTGTAVAPPHGAPATSSATTRPWPPPVASQPATRPGPSPSQWSSAKAAPAAPPPAASPAPEAGGSSPSAPAGDLTLDEVRRLWPRVSDSDSGLTASIKGLLRDGQPVAVEGGAVILGFAHSFHRDTVEDPKSRVLVERALSRVLGRDVRVRCALADKVAPAGRPAAQDDPGLKAMLDVFPGAQIAAVK